MLYQVDTAQVKIGYLLLMQESPLLNNDRYIGKGPFSYKSQITNVKTQVGYFPSSAINSKVDSNDSYKLKRREDLPGILFEVENITKVTKGGDSFIKQHQKTIHQTIKEKEKDTINNVEETVA